MALLAVLLLAGLTANRYVTSDNLRGSIVVTRITGSEAIAQLPADELLTATCPCKESLIQWSSIVSFTPSILAMSHNASKLSDGPDTFKVAQCNAIAITGRPDVISASALNNTETNDMVNNDPCYKWPAQSCSSILGDLRSTLPLVEADDNVTYKSPYLTLPIMKPENELKNIWQDYLNTRADNTYLTAYNSVLTHLDGLGNWLDTIASNTTLQADVPAFQSFFKDTKVWLLANNGDPCSDDPYDLNARGEVRVHAEVRQTTKAFLRENTVLNITKVRETCAPLFCDIQRKKTALTWVTEVLSTIGGLWTVILGSVAIAWALINCFSCMGAGYGSYKVWHQ